MKKRIWVYCNPEDARTFVYVDEKALYRGAILNFGCRRSFWIMGAFLAALFLPLAGLFWWNEELFVFTAPFWSVLWAGGVYLLCRIMADRDNRRYPGNISFRE